VDPLPLGWRRAEDEKSADQARVEHDSSDEHTFESA
jgi:hypothetical protein